MAPKSPVEAQAVSFVDEQKNTNIASSRHSRFASGSSSDDTSNSTNNTITTTATNTITITIVIFIITIIILVCVLSTNAQLLSMHDAGAGRLCAHLLSTDNVNAAYQ